MHVKCVAIANFVCVASPDMFNLGSGVIRQDWLFPEIGPQVQEILAGYVASSTIKTEISSLRILEIMPGFWGEWHWQVEMVRAFY